MLDKDTSGDDSCCFSICGCNLGCDSNGEAVGDCCKGCEYDDTGPAECLDTRIDGSMVVSRR